MSAPEPPATPGDEAGAIVLTRDDLPGQAAYHLLNGLIVPRPIAWVSSLGPAGVPNLAPHSYCTILSTDPPILGFVSTGVKDTLRNIRATGEYVVNIAGGDLTAQMNRSSGNFPPEESEFAWTGLTPIPGDAVRAPRVAEAPAAMEVRLLEIKAIGNGHLIIGEILRWHLSRAILRDGRVDPALLRPIGRHAGTQYSRVGDFFDLERPTWADLARERDGR